MAEPGLDGLRPLGIGAAEEAAYELLLDRPQAGIAELAQAWNRPELLDAVLARLHAAGLIRLAAGSPARYVAAPPQVALEAMVLEQEQRLQAARIHAQRLAATYRDHAVGTEQTPVEVVTGHRALRQRIDQLLRGARDQVRCLDKAPGDGREPTPLLDPRLVPEGVWARTVYDRVSVEEARTLVSGSRPAAAARVLPALPLSTMVVDDGCALLPLWGEPGSTEAAIVVHGSALLRALTELFEGLWQRAIPLDAPGSAGVTGRGRPAGADRQRLVALLLSGLTDQVIARQLGISVRTAQRRLTELTADLGVRTRFQAGVQAAFRDQAAPEAGEPR